MIVFILVDTLLFLFFFFCQLLAERVLIRRKVFLKRHLSEALVKKSGIQMNTSIHYYWPSLGRETKRNLKLLCAAIKE